MQQSRSSDRNSPVGSVGASREAEKTAGGASTDTEEDQELARRLAGIRHKILVLSGKGGVGKSSIAACLAVNLAAKGRKVGVLDIDIHGPSIPRMLGVEGERVLAKDGSIIPVTSPDGVMVMSVGLMLAGRDDAVIWRGPLKYAVIRQFLRDVEWGELDYLIVDSPPGTGDEPLSVAQLIREADGALIVTTPQDISTNDVRRSVGFSRQLNLPILGVVENMSGFVCPECGASVEVFGSGGGGTMADELGCPFLGNVPLDPRLLEACDAGDIAGFLANEHPSARAFAAAASRLVDSVESAGAKQPAEEPAPTGTDEGGDGSGVPSTSGNTESVGSSGDASKSEGRRRTIAVPVTGGLLSEHFGHCESFALFVTAGEDGPPENAEIIEAPEHQPGLLPEWLKTRGVDVVIAGGMGGRAKELFEAKGIEVVCGAQKADPREIVSEYLRGTLSTGPNVCDH